jgi:hypothetical protein
MDRLPLTPRVHAAVVAYEHAAARYVAGHDSSSVVDLPKLALADAVLWPRSPRPRPIAACGSQPARRRP